MRRFDAILTGGPATELPALDFESLSPIVSDAPQEMLVLSARGDHVEYGRIEISWPLVDAGTPKNVPLPKGDSFVVSVAESMAREYGIEAATGLAWTLDLSGRLDEAIAEFDGYGADSGTGLGFRDIGLTVRNVARLPEAFERVVAVLAADSVVPDSATVVAYVVTRANDEGDEEADEENREIASIVLGDRR